MDSAVQVCGDADVWGDGVVPNASAHLEGALNIDLSDVYHSPVGSTETKDDGSEEAPEKRRQWYGSKDIVEKWLGHLFPLPIGNSYS